MRVAAFFLTVGMMASGKPLSSPASSGEQAAPAAPVPAPGELAGNLKSPGEIPEKFLSAYYGERPKAFLVDPQGWLRASDFRDRLAFLNYHASDSSVDLFVYIIGRDQVIPSGVQDQERVGRLFAEGRPAVVVDYYLGAPQRSSMVLSPSIIAAVSPAEQRHALESAVMQANERTNPSEQLERFLVQLSIRIYWMERMIAGELPVNKSVPLLKTDARGKAALKSEKWIRVSEFASRFGWIAAMVLGGVTAICGGIGCLRFRAGYRFPELRVEPRLGGDHAAGVGAVISFASAALPPALQRDQVPDCLRRT